VEIEGDRVKAKSVRQQIGNKVVLYGGLPVRYSTMVRHLQEVAQRIAKREGREDWMGLRDAGLMGHSQAERMHPTELPDDVEPLTYEEFKLVTNLPNGKEIPGEIFRKMITIYPREERWRFGRAAPRKLGSSRVARKSKSKSKRKSRNTFSVRGLR